MEAIVPLMVAMPLGAAFVLVAISHAKGAKRLTGWLTLAAVLVNLVLALVLLSGEVGTVFVGAWGGQKTLGIQLVCDGLTKLMLASMMRVRTSSRCSIYGLNSTRMINILELPNSVDSARQITCLGNVCVNGWMFMTN